MTTDGNYLRLGFHAPARDRGGRGVPWTELEPLASRVARCYTPTANGAPYRLREGDAWALAWVHVSEIIEDATVREVSPWIGIVGDRGWLETTVYAILKARDQDPAAAVKKARAMNVYEEAREGEGGSDG